MCGVPVVERTRRPWATVRFTGNVAHRAAVPRRRSESTARRLPRVAACRRRRGRSAVDPRAADAEARLRPRAVSGNDCEDSESASRRTDSADRQAVSQASRDCGSVQVSASRLAPHYRMCQRRCGSPRRRAAAAKIDARPAAQSLRGGSATECCNGWQRSWTCLLPYASARACCSFWCLHSPLGRRRQLQARLRRRPVR